MKRYARLCLAKARAVMARAKNENGFTLVELVVVIAILGILAGVGTVGYSGYIKKANMAADQVLLDSLNTAFAAACIENGVDVRTLNASQATATIDGTITPADYQDEFDRYYEGGTFKVIQNLVFSQPMGAFIDAGDSVGYEYGDTMIYLSQADVDALKGSTYGDIGMTSLMNKVDYVTKLAVSLMDDAASNSSFVNLIMGQDYGRILADNLKIDMNAEGGEAAFVAAVNGMISDVADNLVTADPTKYAGQDATDPDSKLYQDAYHQIVANNAVMYAAKNSNAVSGDILTVLGGNNSKGSIVATINQNSGEGLAQAAMAYGLYTAYAAKNGVSVSDDPAEVLVALDNDTAFKDYINNKDGTGQAQKDLQGYVAAMNMINTNVNSNTDAVTDILVNGFANDDLIGLLQQATGES